MRPQGKQKQPVRSTPAELSAPRFVSAKRQRLNPVPEKNWAKAEQLSTQEKSAALLAISSAHAEERFRLQCSYGHKGSIV